MEKSIRHLPVLDGKDLLGIITESDIRGAFIGKVTKTQAGKVAMLNPSRMKVSDYMTKEPMEVDRKMWIRGDSAFSSARAAASMSFSSARARPATVDPWISFAICLTDSKSPGDATGKPASMTSTFNRASCRAISNFSLLFMLAPRHCSPSLKVVSNIMSRSGCMVRVRILRLQGYCCELICSDFIIS